MYLLSLYMHLLSLHVSIIPLHVSIYTLCFCLLGKLALRAQKVAHFLLNKLGGGKQVQPGDRVRCHTHTHTHL